MKIPVHCEALWKQLKAADGGSVDVHEQEVTKATDIKTLFELGLIRVVRSQKLLPTVAIVLSESGKLTVGEL